MQFKIAAVVAVMASVAAAQSTVTVYACESTSSGVAKPTAAPTKTVASTGVLPPSPTSSPIFSGAASVNGPALGLLAAGGLALFL